MKGTGVKEKGRDKGSLYDGGDRKGGQNEDSDGLTSSRKGGRVVSCLRCPSHVGFLPLLLVSDKCPGPV